MKEQGTLITCDACGKNGTFLRKDSYDIYPDDWEYRDGKDICPKCLEKQKEENNQVSFDEFISGVTTTLLNSEKG